MHNKDGFWNIDRLLPPNHRGTASAGDLPLSCLSGSDQPRLGSLVSRQSYTGLAGPWEVQVFACPSSGEPGSFSGFLARAQRLCAAQPQGGGEYRKYFSYSPDYNQLDPAQLQTYLSFRQAVRQRQRVATEYSYFLLLTWELLHLATPATAPDTLEQLLWLWEEYRSDFAVVDKLFCDWVLDLCLEFSLPFPYARLAGLLPRICFRQTPYLYQLFIFEYLLDPQAPFTRESLQFLLSCLCNYRYQALSLYRENGAYRQAMDGFLLHLFSAGLLRTPALRQDFLHLKIPTQVTVTRKMYPAVGMDPLRRRQVQLSYCPLLPDANVNYRFTALVQYADNLVRKRLGKKPKFSSVFVSERHARFIQEQFSLYFPGPASQEPAQPVPAAPVHTLKVHLENARGIEEGSWQTTRTLTDGLYDEPEPIPEPLPVAPRAPEPAAEAESLGDALEELTELCAAMDDTQLHFCALLLYRPPAQAKRFALGVGQFSENLARGINQLAMEHVQDVILDPAGRILAEYRSHLEFLLPEDTYLSSDE